MATSTFGLAWKDRFCASFGRQITESWIVPDKSGTIVEIGRVNGNGPAPGGLSLAGVRALERNPDDTKEIYRWHLTRQYDQHIEGGVPLNLVVYDYLADTSGRQATSLIFSDTSPAADAAFLPKRAHLRITRGSGGNPGRMSPRATAQDG